MLTALTALLLLLVAGALVGGCGGDEGPSTEGLPEVPAADVEDLTGESAVEVSAVDNRYEPQYVKVTAGTTVTFTNDGRNEHNVLAADEGAFPDIPTAEFGPGASGEITFDEPGTYAYYCSLHGTATRGMNGRIIVEPADG